MPFPIKMIEIELRNPDGTKRKRKMKKSDSSKAVTMMQQSIKVFNADGTLKKDYGVVNYWHKNPLKRLAFKARQFFKRITGE